MCGRFTQAEIAELDREIFRLLEVPALAPRYNVAPTQDAAVVRAENGDRRMRFLRWGLIPAWADDPAMGQRLINARVESAAQKPAFRDALRWRRCIVPADGFYEWRRTSHGKAPYYIRPRHGGVFALAGLWERWRPPKARDAMPVETFTILTTPPNAVVAELHDRMPAIVPVEALDRWLDPTVQDSAALAELLGPYPAAEMEAYAVSRYVNDPAHEGPECVQPAEP